MNFPSTNFPPIFAPAAENTAGLVVADPALLVNETNDTIGIMAAFCILMDAIVVAVCPSFVLMVLDPVFRFLMSAVSFVLSLVWFVCRKIKETGVGFWAQWEALKTKFLVAFDLKALDSLIVAVSSEEIDNDLISAATVADLVEFAKTLRTCLRLISWTIYFVIVIVAGIVAKKYWIPSFKSIWGNYMRFYKLHKLKNKSPIKNLHFDHNSFLSDCCKLQV